MSNRISNNKLNLFLAIVCIPYLLLIFYVGPWYSKKINFFTELSSLKGFIIGSITFLLYYLLKKENKSSDYSLLSRFFHRITLGSKMIRIISFDIEKTIFLKKSKKIEQTGEHIFISGLARSGTTALMNALHETKQFTSLTYSDLPLILAPNLSKRLLKTKKTSEPKERAHKDGILIDTTSPEALDEVFWKTVLNNNYIQKDCLKMHSIPTDVMDQFEEYIKLILNKNRISEAKRYLSKNNNTILRMEQLLEHFPHSKVIIPFRSPLDHALSLLNKHLHFSELQTYNRFSLNYMNWLGHNEFGLNQKPFFLENEQLFNRIHSYPKEDINYWLLSWLNYYSYILKHPHQRILLFSYDAFCKNPNKELDLLAQKIRLIDLKFELPKFKPQKRTTKGIDKSILEECKKIYEQLLYQLEN